MWGDVAKLAQRVANARQNAAELAQRVANARQNVAKLAQRVANARRNAAKQAQKVANAIKTGNRGAGALRWLGGRERPVRHAFCARRSFEMRAEMRRELATVSF